MRKSSELHNWLRVMAGMLMLFAVLAVGLGSFSITGHADSAGKVTAAGARIRKEASTSSEVLASLEQNDVISIKGQIKGGDGYTWYQVDDAGMTGYIRSDLISITDGSTPPTIATTTTPTTPTTSTPTTSTPDETLVDVTEVEPVSGTVSGGSPVRVRQNASTTSRIVSTVQSGQTLTVTGTATGTDGKEWRRVSFNSGSSQINGFIRADYVSVSEDLVPPGTEPQTPGNVEQPDPVDSNATETKAWDTYYENGTWHLRDNSTANTYDIQQIFDSVEANTKTLNDTIKSHKTQQIIVIFLVILLVILAAVISYLVFKLKDMTDSAYFNEVERETVRRRTADRPTDRNQNRQRSVGAEGSRRPAGQRPSGQRPAGLGGGGQRPAGQRPSGQRPAGTGGDGQRPTGQRPSDQRPTGTGSSQRPADQRPAGQRPVDRRPTDSKPENEQEVMQTRDSIPQEAPQDYAPEHAQDHMREQEKTSSKPREKTGWKSRNFADDDEFEFQFLDWDGEEK